MEIVPRCSEITLRGLGLSDLFPYQIPRHLILIYAHWLWLKKSGSYSIKELHFVFHNPPITKNQLIWVITWLTSNAKGLKLSLLGLKATSLREACKVGVQTL